MADSRCRSKQSRSVAGSGKQIQQITRRSGGGDLQSPLGVAVARLAEQVASIEAAAARAVACANAASAHALAAGAVAEQTHLMLEAQRRIDASTADAAWARARVVVSNCTPYALTVTPRRVGEELVITVATAPAASAPECDASEFERPGRPS